MRLTSTQVLSQCAALHGGTLQPINLPMGGAINDFKEVNTLSLFSRDCILLRRAFSLKFKYETVKFSNCVLAITSVIMNGQTFKVFENINGVQNKGNVEMNTA